MNAPFRLGDIWRAIASDDPFEFSKAGRGSPLLGCMTVIGIAFVCVLTVVLWVL